MKVALRLVAVSLVVSLAGAGPLVSVATAQQPAAPTPGTAPSPPLPPAAVAPAPTQPQMFQEQLKAETPDRPIDAYDVGAAAATALGLPFKVGICALGAAFSTVVFAASFASRPDASAAIVTEACGGKSPWIVRGRDIRPKPSVSKAFDWETQRFDWER